MAFSAKRPKFTPNPLVLAEHVVWVLKRAFGPPERDVSLRDAQAALEAADLLGYLPRIGQRTPRARLDAELGELSGLVVEASHRAAAGAAALNATSRFVREVAAEHGLPAVFLKFSALAALGVVRPGARVASDVDVLAARHHGEALVQALVARGARVLSQSRFEHELAGLISPFGTTLDVHRHVPGLRLASGDRFMTADELIGAGMVEARAASPDPAVLAAHALTHGLIQNAGIPQSGAPARAFADLADLERFARGTLERSLPLLTGLFDHRDTADITGLYVALESGQVEPGYDGPGASLLSHVLGTALDAGYAASLRKFLFAAPLSERTGPEPWLERIIRVVMPSQHDLARIYGQPAGKLGMLRFRLWRPLDLTGRTLGLVFKR